ncbi:hypothetical protein KSF_089380 [Reticulibacter mediterranei]|uniref:TIR domain-containing protein n=1 Tax=Reticulibacter mediterranei TaxID=2778369 RepID=A0A8J3N7V8_9CHLR|nr:toll/interleukin-1 receptor domain-containing protein [Reticulibacter mediterranei]GHO98890.1 hypothetical protein KSF_089380 [Reticulibacter mediterranei]
MANKEHLEIIKQGVDIWNKWREEHTGERPDLSSADLSSTNLRFVNLSEAALKDTNFRWTDLSGSDLSRADLRDAYLDYARLLKADLSGADLSGADLRDTDLSRADLSGADLSRASVGYTSFGDRDFRRIKGLETISHDGPSPMGINSLYLSEGDIPEVFVRGTGAPDTFIEYMRSLAGNPIDYYTCFISYSCHDQAFAERLYADLQNKGVRCWFAPEDMKTGDVIRDRIDQSIRLYDKLLLVLSEHSVQSKWVRFEVEAALEKECEGKPPVLFPVRLDNAVLNSSTSWAAHIQRSRHITDFSQWKQHDDYQRAFTRLLHDLQPEKR